MRFRLESAMHYFRFDNRQLNVLRELGFRFEEYTSTILGTKERPWRGLRCINNEEVEIEIGTLEELMVLIDRLDERLVMERGRIIIYNDYLE